jgi:hypothetical protein
VAVAVEQAPQLVLDEEYCIVAVGPGAEAGFGPLRGRSMWEIYPGSRSLFEPYYEKARRSGEPVEFVQFYDGVIEHVRAVPDGIRLLLYWELVHRLNTLTLDGLRESLEGAIAALAVRERSLRRGELRVLEGGSQ